MLNVLNVITVVSHVTRTVLIPLVSHVLQPGNYLTLGAVIVKRVTLKLELNYAVNVYYTVFHALIAFPVIHVKTKDNF
jgi:hypothetical protein